MTANDKAPVSDLADHMDKEASQSQSHNTTPDKPVQPRARLIMVIEHDPGQKVKETALIRIMRERGHQITSVERCGHD